MKKEKHTSITTQSGSSTKTEDIKYSYFHWGPFLFHTEITQEELEPIEKGACIIGESRKDREKIKGWKRR